MPRHGPEEEEQLIEALVATRTEQRLQRDRAEQLDDVAEVLLDSDVPLSPSKGRHELLAALLQRLEQRSTSSDTQSLSFPPIPELSGAWLAAADKGHVRCLSLILDTCKHRPTALKQLLEESGEEGDTALMLASKTAEPGQLECMRLLLEHSPDAQVTDIGDQMDSALMCASRYNNAAGMELLLTHIPEKQVAAVNCNLCSALIIAALGGHAACLKLLLAHSPDQQVAATDTYGSNALMFAAKKGHAACLQLLLAHSPDAQLAVEPVRGKNALSAAAKFLLDAKARCAADSAAASGGSSSGGALQRDLMAGRECVELLLAHGAQLPDSVDAELRGAFWPIVQESVRRARVPDMANAAVVGLALAATAAGRGKRPAEGEEGGAAAGPPPAKAARTDA